MQLILNIKLYKIQSIKIAEAFANTHIFSHSFQIKKE